MHVSRRITPRAPSFPRPAAVAAPAPQSGAGAQFLLEVFFCLSFPSHRQSYACGPPGGVSQPFHGAQRLALRPVAESTRSSTGFHPSQNCYISGPKIKPFKSSTLGRSLLADVTASAPSLARALLQAPAFVSPIRPLACLALVDEDHQLDVVVQDQARGRASGSQFTVIAAALAL